MAAFWDKIKSAKKDSDEKKEQRVEDVRDDEKKEQKKEEGGNKRSKGKKEKEKNVKSKKKSKKRILNPQDAILVNKVRAVPKVSESAMNKQSLGKYVFIVSRNSGKFQIARAIEAMYGVNVEKVNTVCYKPENHGFRGMPGKKSGYKKAIVSLKEGDSIELFKEGK